MARLIYLPFRSLKLKKTEKIRSFVVREGEPSQQKRPRNAEHDELMENRELPSVREVGYANLKHESVISLRNCC